MDTHFLDEYLEQCDLSKEHTSVGTPWYNAHGDCIVFQTADEAIVADRIDQFLTIYRWAVDHRPIGFQVKDVKALLDKHGRTLLQVRTDVSGDAIISVRTTLFAAFAALTADERRILGYAAAPLPGVDEIRYTPAA